MAAWAKSSCRGLKAEGIPFVAIEKSAESMPVDTDLFTVEGDATHDDLLKHVGIETCTWTDLGYCRPMPRICMSF